LQKSAIVLADFPRFFESAGAFAVKATEVALDILDVIFEIAADDSRIVPRGLRITWQEGAGRSRIPPKPARERRSEGPELAMGAGISTSGFSNLLSP